MILHLLILISATVYASDPSWKWSNAAKIVEKHEFYKNNEVITKPKDSWQIIFAVLYNDTNLKSFKDCVFYRVPGEEMGQLKIKTVDSNVSCEKYLFQPGDQEWKQLKAFQFTIQKNFLNLSMTNNQFQIIKWDVPLFNTFEHPIPKSLMSAAEYRAPKIIYLSPYKGFLKVLPQKSPVISDKKICHEINEDCIEKSPSTCSQCSGGWYEIPIGCKQGPKYCGSIICGAKNQPACSKGTRFQRMNKEFKCREDNSFAYCTKGLTIQCQGHLPYCI